MDDSNFEPFSKWKEPLVSKQDYYESKSTDKIMKELKGGAG